jgi:hypothetical protein
LYSALFSPDHVGHGPMIFFKPDSYPCRAGPVKENLRGGHRHPGMPGKSCSSVFLSSFACPKEETRKRHPNQSWPYGLPLLLAEGGTRKNSGFALKQFPRLFPPPSARRGRTNGGRKKSHWHAAEHRRGCRKGDLHCLSVASLQSPGSIEEHRASRLRRDKCLGALSLVRFFGQAKK